ncbi:uncharacterized protein LOC122291102 [Carya illinoinensis]|uniref:uncharacterized protein LOC122291102 n=1 Tax=Carya illinoinensis TaxID=32201 RepID=UPI001C725DAB|nr:uncharacterized protein LOC122291102 [Carya illinoinensis]
MANPHQSLNRNNAPLEEIGTIVECLIGCGPTSSKRKTHARRARYEKVFVIKRPPKQTKNRKAISISFGDEDCNGVQYPHEVTLVVTLRVANYTTLRILVDNGSSTDVLNWDAFTKLGFDPSQLRPSPTLLKGLSRDAIPHVGTITLPMFIGKGPYTTTTMIDSMVIKAPSSYNAILGHPTLNHLKAITSTYHQKIKFLIEEGVGQVHGEQL